MRRFTLLLAVGLVAVACGGDRLATRPSPSPPSSSASPGGPPSSSAPSTGPSAPDLRNVRIRLRQIATLDGGPLALAVRSGDPALYVAEKAGRVTAIRGGQVDPRPVLDLTGRVSSGSEQGLLGLAFSADGRFLYVNYTDVNGDTNVVEYAMDGDRTRRGSARRLLFIRQPYPNHNGGNLATGPDGYLYVGMGDGGSQGDPMQNGQNPSSLLAKMLRIDPRPSGGRAYGIPPDNPFVSRPGARGEVWAFGLRNPWRFSFDRQTRDLWIGDVGGSEREEIDFQRGGSGGGQNYGWSLMEGTLRQSEDLPAGMVTPVYEYETGSGGTCAITGGYVYRGSAIPDLRGAYLFSDFCGGEIKAFRFQGGKARQLRTLATARSVASFGEDGAGELYVLSLAGPVYEIVPG